MAEPTVLSSVVVIPEEAQLEGAGENGNSLKRRQSSISESSDSNKRPRLEKQPSPVDLNNGEPLSATTAPNASSPSTNTDGQAGQGHMSPPAPRRRQTSGLEQDKSRNRRLFGALLGTLSQSSQPTRRSSAGGAVNSNTPSTTSLSRREEIESRQRERLKRESQDIADSVRLKRQKLDRERRMEQARWDEEALGLRHKNMRVTAGFLQTKTKPILYYKPWELRDFEEEKIKRQLEDVDAKIEQERDDFTQKNKHRREELQLDPDRETSANTETSPASPAVKRNGTMNMDHTDGVEDAVQKEAEDDVKNGLRSDADEKTNGKHVPDPELASGLSEESQLQKQPIDNARPRSSSKTDEHDHGGEELERGQEDDVIY